MIIKSAFISIFTLRCAIFQPFFVVECKTQHGRARWYVRVTDCI